jgi:chromosome segregation ATPase
MTDPGSSLNPAGCRGILEPLPTVRDAANLQATGRGARDMGEESFVLIEKRIGDLVQVVAALKKEKGELAEELTRKESEVRELGKKLAEMTRERNEVKERVEKILSRLDSIEL